VDQLVVSGGFAVVQPDSQLSVNAVEGFPLEDFSAEVSTMGSLRNKILDRMTDVSLSQAVRAQIAEAQKIASGSGSEQDIAEAKIELEVCFFPYISSINCALSSPGVCYLAY
jgi:F-type H+-transporting ATPase subunit delta